MSPGTRIPKLFDILYGEHAEMCLRMAGERLLRWSAAFDDWLAQFKYPTRHRSAVQAWTRLLLERRKLPWELTRKDIEEHKAVMESAGYASATIRQALWYATDFYRWCLGHRIDPECGEAYNPAAGVSRPKEKRYANARMLSREEMEAFLEVLRSDETPLGKRDYAFFLSRLRLGVPHRALQELRWGQIEQQEGGAWVRWQVEGEPAPLPGEVWEAIRDYLRSSGRWEDLQPNEYVFAPLYDLTAGAQRSRKEAWAGGCKISGRQIVNNLKVYGRTAEIEEEKLSMPCLLNTALRLKLDEGADLEAMSRFMNRRHLDDHLKQRLKDLPPLPPDKGYHRPPVLVPPKRTCHVFTPEEKLKHGLYAGKLPEDQVEAVLEEEIEGVEEEVACLRSLTKWLLAARQMTDDPRELERLLSLYPQVAVRISDLTEVQKLLDRALEDPWWVEAHLQMLDDSLAEMGQEPISGMLREFARCGDPEHEEEFFQLLEATASMRAVLRNTYRLAEAAFQEGDLHELVVMAGIYDRGCAKLIKLLRRRAKEGNFLPELLYRCWDYARRKVLFELGWPDEEDPDVVYGFAKEVDEEVVREWEEARKKAGSQVKRGKRGR